MKASWRLTFEINGTMITPLNKLKLSSLYSILENAPERIREE
jgi:hypothetical protein